MVNENTVEQLKILHKRSGQSAKERSKLFKQLKTTAERTETVDDAVAHGKSLVPFGGVYAA
jgi:hypothetical protein